MSQSEMIFLKGSHRDKMEGSEKIDHARQDEFIQVLVRVRRKDDAGFKAKLQAVQTNNKPLTLEEYEKAHSSSAEDMKAVEDYARSQGLSVVRSESRFRYVELAGKVSQFQEAFKTQLNLYSHDHCTYRGREGELSIPANLKDVIIGVFGLDTRPFLKSHHKVSKMSSRHDAPVSSFTGCFTGDQLAKIYNFPSVSDANIDGTGQTIGFIELGGGYSPTDVSQYCKELTLPKTPLLTPVLVGAQNAFGGANDGDTIEVMLDIEAAAGAAPGAKMVVYFAPNDNTGTGFLKAMIEAVHDAVNKPTIISISWGGPESASTASYMHSFNQTLETAAALNITVIVASGDNGAADEGPHDWQAKANVDFPSSSPYILSVGGTTLKVTENKIDSEIVWNQGGPDFQDDSFGASGGGISETQAIPSWQTAVNNIPDANDNANVGQHRGVPDVAAVGDPATGYIIRISGGNMVIGGTSGAAPLWAALIAQINQSLKAPVGFINPVLYDARKTAFNIVSAGTNKVGVQGGKQIGYSVSQATDVWNPCTGLGTPDGVKLLAAIKAAKVSAKAKA